MAKDGLDWEKTMAAEFFDMKEKGGKVVLEFTDTETMKMIELEFPEEDFNKMCFSMPLDKLYETLTAKANEVVERWKRGEQQLEEERKEVFHVAPDGATGGNTTAH